MISWIGRFSNIGRVARGGAVIICGALALILPPGVHAQTAPWDSYTPKDDLGEEMPRPAFVTTARRLFIAPEQLDAPDEWITRSLQWVDFILGKFRPGVVENPMRHAALIRLDDILHITSAPKKAPVRDFFRLRMERAIGEIERTKLTEGMRIWKLYNHGFIVKTPTVTLAFDVIPGFSGGEISGDLLDRIVAQSDVLFISHLHGDHANRDVVGRFLAAGKPVVAPEVLWPERPEIAKRLTVLERSADITHDLKVRAGTKVLKVVAYPGRQGAVALNNVTLVTTPDGFTVVHTGDEAQAEKPPYDMNWISNIARDHKVDVLMVNIWTQNLDRVIRGVDPELVLSGHENEMGHDVPRREDYTKSYSRLFGINYPSIIMTWGESYLYNRTESD